MAVAAERNIQIIDRNEKDIQRNGVLRRAGLRSKPEEHGQKDKPEKERGQPCPHESFFGSKHSRTRLSALHFRVSFKSRDVFHSTNATASAFSLQPSVIIVSLCSYAG